MLRTCANHPNIFDEEINCVKDKYYYEVILSYFDKIIKNGIILDSEENELIAIMNKNINSWPENCKKKLQERIKILRKSKRIIRLKKYAEHSKDVCGKCNEYDVCNLFNSILNENIDGIVVPRDCFQKLKETNNVISIDSMTDSDLDIKLNKVSYTIDSHYSFETFENEIMYPMFKYCKNIKILDRTFGNCIMNRNMELKDNYKRGLTYILKMIKNSNVNIDKLSVEIYTSIRGTKDKEKQTQINQKIEDFLEELMNEYGLNVTCYFKEPYADFTHDRYIFTDQIGVQIGRGIDLLDENDRLRKMTISVIDNSEKRKLETETRGFDDIEF